MLRAEEYETLVAELIARIAGRGEVPKPRVDSGRRHRVMGKSGFAHQIDVSVTGVRCDLLIECKKWKNRVTVGALLTFAARVLDIRAASPSKVIDAALVTTKGYQRGCEMLAEHFRIQLQVCKDLNQFQLRYGDRLAVGVLVSDVGTTVETCSANCGDT